MSADRKDLARTSESAGENENNNESSTNLLLDSQPERRPPPYREPEFFIDEAEQKKYEQNLDQAKDKLHDFPVSKELRKQDVELLHQLQDAILSKGSLDGSGIRVDPSKFIELARKLEQGGFRGHAIIENLNASLAQYGIKVGHTTGEVSLMIKDPSGDGKNLWMVVHANGKPTDAFFTDERTGRFFPLDPVNIFTQIQSRIVNPPEIGTRYNDRDWRYPVDPIWPPPPPWRR